MWSRCRCARAGGVSAHRAGVEREIWGNKIRVGVIWKGCGAA